MSSKIFSVDVQHFLSVCLGKTEQTSVCVILCNVKAAEIAFGLGRGTRHVRGQGTQDCKSNSALSKGVPYNVHS